MTDGHENTGTQAPADRDELAAKQYGRDLRQAISFREEVFARDQESVVTRTDAAVVLGLRESELERAIDEGRLRVTDVDGERIIRVADLQMAFNDETRRREEFAKGWTQLRAKFDWDE